MHKRLIAFLLSIVLVGTTFLPYFEKQNISEVQAAQGTGSGALRLWYTSPAGGERAENNYNDGTDYSAWSQESLPIGNGKIGANIYGRTGTERIIMTEETFWSGGPKTGENSGDKASSNPRSFGNLLDKGKNGEVVKKAQDAFRRGNANEASSLVKGSSDPYATGNNNQGLVGPDQGNGSQGYGFQLSYANMFLVMNHTSPQNYIRDLDLSTAISNVDYIQSGIAYHRDNFVSNPSEVMVTRLTASDNGPLNFTLKMKPDTDSTNGTNNNNGGRGRKYDVETKSTDGVENNTSNIIGSIDIAGTLDDNNLNFASTTLVISESGTATISGGQSVVRQTNVATNTGGELQINATGSVVIITSIYTNYEQSYPDYRKKKEGSNSFESKEDVLARTKEEASAAASKGYDELRREHIADYQGLFNRLSLDLGGSSNRTTNALRSGYSSASAEEKKYLETLLYQYGRYLTIASSRESSQLPSNLQGIWVGANNSPWHSDFHLNVNEQMNYWPTYSGNLAECAKPLVEYVNGLREPGRLTARIYAGISSEASYNDSYNGRNGAAVTLENTDKTAWDDTVVSKEMGNGFMAHTQNTPYGWTAPGWNFSWGWSPAAVPWIIQNCWEYYEYTGDVNYMRDHIFPMMREECRLYVQMLDKRQAPGYNADDYYYISTPAYSPEHGPLGDGNTYEQTLVWQLFHDTLEAAKILGYDKSGDMTAEIAQFQEIYDHLYVPIEVGASGQIKEWYMEVEFNKDKDGKTLSGQGSNHRHLSHLLGLYPGDLVSVETPEWFQAGKWSMEHRTDNSEGWSIGQRINTWARLRMGDKAYQIIGNQISQKIFSNLWDWHSPSLFQIDGNFGYTAAVNEMLMQSNLGYIDILPALPSAWPSGSISGIVARGNFALDMAWEAGKATKVQVTSQSGGDCVIKYPGVGMALVCDKMGNPIDSKKITVLASDKIKVKTQKDEVFVVTDFADEDNTEFVENFGVYRIAADSVYLNWQAVEEGDYTYNVYRQIGKGKKNLVAEGLTDTFYIDKKGADESRGVCSYSIVPTLEGENKKETPLVAELDIRYAGTVGADSNRILYTGEWTKSVDERVYGGVTATAHSTMDSESVELIFVGTGIEVYTSKGKGFGSYEVFIDGERVDTVSTLGEEEVNACIMSVDDLEPKVHRIKLVSVGNGRVSFNAFTVQDVSIEKPNSIVIGAGGKFEAGQYVNGIERIASLGSNIQYDVFFNSASENADFSGLKVLWSVTDEAGASTDVASIDKKGVLTTVAAGKVIVKAALEKDTSINAEVSLEILEAGVNGHGTRIEDSINPGNKKNYAYNSAIKYYKKDGTEITSANGSSANSWYIFTENGHSGGSKAESNQADDYVEFTFDGVGVELYAPVHFNNSGFHVFVDGNYYGIANLYKDGADYKNYLAYTWHEGDPIVDNAPAVLSIAEEQVTLEPNMAAIATELESLEDDSLEVNVKTDSEETEVVLEEEAEENVLLEKDESVAFEEEIQIPEQVVEKEFAPAYAVEGNHQHTIKLVVYTNTATNKTNACVDCFVVLSPPKVPASYKDLSEKVAAATLLDPDYFAEDDWNAFREQLSDAIDLLNDSETTADNDAIASMIADLESKESALTPNKAEPDISNLNLRLAGADYSEATINWNKVKGVTGYEILLEKTDSKENQTLRATSQETSYSLTGLEPETEYKVTLIAIREVQNAEGQETGKYSAVSKPITFKTVAKPDYEAPVKNEDAGISIEFIADDIAVADWDGLFSDGEETGKLRFNVYVNKVLVYNGTDTSYKIRGIEADKMYSISIEAIDEAGNTSMPVNQGFARFVQDVNDVSLNIDRLQASTEESEVWKDIKASISSRSGKEDYICEIEVANDGGTQAKLEKNDNDTYRIKAYQPGQIALRVKVLGGSGEEGDFEKNVYISVSQNGEVLLSEVEFKGVKAVALEEEDRTFPNGTPLSTIVSQLPKTATIITNGEDFQGTIRWNTDNVKYNSESNKEQTFILSGEVDIERMGFANPKDISSILKVEIIVKASGGTVDGLFVQDIQDMEYTGAAIKPVVKVFDGDVELGSTDYTVSYKNNVNPGKASVIIKGKGNYSGEEVITFNILKKNIADTDVEVPDLATLANGKVQKLKPVLTYNKKKLTYDKDYELLYDPLYNYKDPKEYEITVVGKGNYTGYRTVKLSIVEGVLVSKLAISKIVTAWDYTGDPIKPPVTVSDKGVKLVAGKDYEITYKDNTEIGTGRIIIKGIMHPDSGKGYAGEKVLTFKINGVPLSKAAVDKLSIPTKVFYTGDAITISPKLSYGEELTQDVDYTIDYAGTNINAGKATATLTGKGRFTGTVKKTFTIVPLKVNENGEVLSNQRNDNEAETRKITVDFASTVPYSKNGAKPIPEVKFGENTLKSGVAYTLSYKNNANPISEEELEKTGKKPEMTITLKGNFSGKIVQNFAIDKKELNSGDVKMSAVDKTYSSKAGSWVSAVTLVDQDGKKLVAGKDYDKTVTYSVVKEGSKYKPASELGEEDFEETSLNTKTYGEHKIGDVICVTAEALDMSPYSGQLRCIYRITEKMISKTKVTTAIKEYTGKEVKLDYKDIVIMDGNKELVGGEDYIILEDYKNNINKGTATVTLKGISDTYGGTVNVKYSIGTKGMLWWFRSVLGN